MTRGRLIGLLIGWLQTLVVVSPMQEVAARGRRWLLSSQRTGELVSGQVIIG